MKIHRPAITGSLLLVFAFPAILGGRVGKKEYESSLVCESCHSEIFEEWKTSYHATSWEDSLFQDVYAAIRAKDKEASCLSCHAPIAWKIGDGMVMERMSREGVNCDYCHTLHAFRERGSTVGFRSRPGKTKLGRLGQGQSIYHGIQEEDGYGSAEYCATCHHFRNRYGVLIYSEYETWRRSDFRRRGIGCQDCHMLETTGKASNYGSIRDDVSDHRFHGWRSSDMLRKACNFTAGLSVSRDSVRVRTVVQNSGAGHKFPGGTPLRELIVKFVGLSDSGRELFEELRLQCGVSLEVPDGDSLNFWEARSVLEDTRLDPGERREITSTFPRMEGLKSIEVSLLFYPIPLRVVEEKELEMEPPVIYKKTLKVR